MVAAERSWRKMWICGREAADRCGGVVCGGLDVVLGSRVSENRVRAYDTAVVLRGGC